MYRDELYNKTNEMHFLEFVLITSSTCFEEASYSSPGGNFTVYVVYGMYHAFM